MWSCIGARAVKKKKRKSKTVKIVAQRTNKSLASDAHRAQTMCCRSLPSQAAHCMTLPAFSSRSAAGAGGSEYQRSVVGTARQVLMSHWANEARRQRGAITNMAAPGKSPLSSTALGCHRWPDDSSPAFDVFAFRTRDATSPKVKATRFTATGFGLGSVGYGMLAISV